MSPRTLAVLRARGIAVRRAVALSRRGGRPVHRLDLEGGGRLKIRRFKSSSRAAEVWRLLGAVPGSILPRREMLAGRALIMEYIEGEVLSDVIGRRAMASGGRWVRPTGELLAALHRARVPRSGAVDPPEYRRRLTLAVRRLARAGHLDADTAERFATMPGPGRMRLVLTHGDLYPRNLVAAGGRALRAIDVERLEVRPAAFELARTIVRWPLDRRGERVLLDAYGSGGGDAGRFVRERAFWMASALAASALYRLVYRPKALRPVIAAFNRLAADL